MIGEKEVNILADEQQKIFESGLGDEECVLRKKEFYELYFKTRHKEEQSFLGKLSLKTRKRLHRVILLIFRIKNFLSGFSYEVIKDERRKTKRPIIFALTHVGKYDIEVSAVPLKEHFYLLSGDYEHLQGTIDGTFLQVNGVLYFNEKVKSDRRAVVDRMIKHLNDGGNLMYFPEGTWNLTPHLPVLPCYWGIVDIAQKSNAIVVPVAVEQYGKHFKVNIGQNFDMQVYGFDSIEKSRAINNLRDILSTLKWEIWETEPMLKRNKVDSDEWNNYVEKRFSEWPYFNLEYIEGMTYKQKNVMSRQEAFEFMNQLEPNRRNALRGIQNEEN